MWGEELSIRLILEHLLFVERRQETWDDERRALEQRKAWTATGVKAAFENFLPADQGCSIASVYAEFAHRQGWLTADRVLVPAEYASMHETINSWADQGRVWADVTSAFGPPSVLLGGSNPYYGKTLGYLSEEVSAPMVFFHLWNGTDRDADPSWPPTREQPLLLAIRRGDVPFPISFTFTPEGYRRRPEQEDCLDNSGEGRCWCIAMVGGEGDDGPMSNRGLPSSATACLTISETVPEFGPAIAQQARIHARAAGELLERRRLRTSLPEAKNLINEVTGSGGSNSSHVNTWLGRMTHILGGFNWAAGDPPNWDPGGIRGTLYPALQEMDRGDSWLLRASEGEVRLVLSELHRCLVALAGSLPSSVPRSPLLPVRRPPKFARLHENTVAESVAEELATLIDEGTRQYEAALRGGWTGSSRKSALSWRFEDVLAAFLTDEVRRRYQEATDGFEHVEVMAGGRPANLTDHLTYAAYRETAAGIHPRIHSSYVAIATNYLMEVLELMPDYAEASGQGKRRDPVTVYGNVGAINSQVHGSHVSVGDTVASIGATISAVADRGEIDVAAGLRALAEAIQLAPELAEEERVELLDHVADVADAAAAPDEPRRVNRARAAMAMITTAAGASAQIAEAVDSWRHIGGQLF